ncbi:MAG: glycosyltransferase [Phycisphaerales bacterium]|nr:glycosyltransferase [Phycisphaerales bacterium]
MLPETLRAIHSVARELGISYEVVVADDASTDGTVEVCRRHDAGVVSIDRRQISAARNAAARASRGDVLIFVDADTCVTVGAVREAIAGIEGGAVGGGGPVVMDGPVPRWAGVMLGMTIWLFRVFKYTGGCYLFCSRAGYEKSGGWDERMFAGEEIEMARALKRVGRFVIVRTAVVTSGRKLRSYSGWEIAKVFGRMAISPRKAVRDRAGLELWYGERRVDPGSGE